MIKSKTALIIVIVAFISGIFISPTIFNLSNVDTNNLLPPLPSENTCHYFETHWSTTRNEPFNPHLFTYQDFYKGFCTCKTENINPEYPNRPESLIERCHFNGWFGE
ncbi:MAG: hypothetical protein MUO73_05235 [Thermoplasmata archaeon]|nr:hypothetical protein [Thermoplasmata archaeon]